MTKDQLKLLALETLVLNIASCEVDDMTTDKLTKAEKATFYKHYEIYQDSIINLLNTLKKGVKK